MNNMIIKYLLITLVVFGCLCMASYFQYGYIRFRGYYFFILALPAIIGLNRYAKSRKK